MLKHPGPFRYQDHYSSDDGQYKVVETANFLNLKSGGVEDGNWNKSLDTASAFQLPKIVITWVLFVGQNI